MSKEFMGEPDYSQYNAMSTEELEAILDEIDGDENHECSDPALAAHILGLITERNRETLEREFPADEMFQQFQDLHLEPFLAEGAEKQQEQVRKDIGKQPGKPPMRLKRALSHAAGIAAILVLILGASTVIARALGVDLWASFARWGEGSFWFDVPRTRETELAPLPQQLEEFGEKMEYYYMPSELLPRYLPEEYQADELYFAEAIDAAAVDLWLLKKGDPEDKIIVLSTIYHIRTAVGSYSMDDEIDPEIYQHNGHDFYVFTNYDWITVVYRERNVEVSFAGKDRETIYQMIDSVP